MILLAHPLYVENGNPLIPESCAIVYMYASDEMTTIYLRRHSVDIKSMMQVVRWERSRPSDMNRPATAESNQSKKYLVKLYSCSDSYCNEPNIIVIS